MIFSQQKTRLILMFVMALYGSVTVAYAEQQASPPSDKAAAETTTTLAAAPTQTAVEKIQAFYRNYFDYYHKMSDASNDENIPSPEIDKSEAFNADIKKSDELCTQYSDDGPCGWAADGDPYLNSQDADSDLNFTNSAITFTETQPGTIEVKLNINPSTPEGSFRTIIYKMVQEKGQWAADDILYTDGTETASARDMLGEERQVIGKELKK